MNQVIVYNTEKGIVVADKERNLIYNNIGLKKTSSFFNHESENKYVIGTVEWLCSMEKNYPNGIFDVGDRIVIYPKPYNSNQEAAQTFCINPKDGIKINSVKTMTEEEFGNILKSFDEKQKTYKTGLEEKTSYISKKIKKIESKRDKELKKAEEEYDKRVNEICKTYTQKLKIFYQEKNKIMGENPRPRLEDMLFAEGE